LNYSHLQAVLWLRWRILVNRIRRGGKLGSVMFGVLLFFAACTSLGLFVLALVLGLTTLEKATPFGLMATWAGLALGFLFFWMVGLLTDLQRSDSMSFKHLLHLPVSLRWVFLYNYLSSFVSFSVGIFLPAMLGLCIAMTVVLGPAMLVSIPLVLAYFGMITALTYQLRGWLARLMEDKRRGRTVLAALTMGFVLVLQAPNLLNLTRQESSRAERQRVRAERRELRDTIERGGPERVAAEEALARLDAQERSAEAELDTQVSFVATVLPVGWLPYGVRATHERRWLPSALCLLGMLGIGGWSLQRSYRTTLDFTTGARRGGKSAAAKLTKSVAKPGAARKPSLVERTLPFVADAEAAIAFATLRALLRAPEAKLLLLSPIILLGLFGFLLAKTPALDQLGDYAPAMSLGAASTGLLSILQLIQNQFGLDRAGFRAFVLSPVPRTGVLRGKNLAVAPLALGVGLAALIGLACFVPLDASHFLGGCLQMVSAYLLACLVGNTISILGPMRLKENALKAENVNAKTILWQLLSLILIPIVLSPLLIPFGVEFALRALEFESALPVYLILHALGLAAVVLLYRWLIQHQGELLQAREQRILELLTRV
jgi:hypothetical protein